MEEMYEALRMQLRTEKMTFFLAKTTKPQNSSEVGDRGLQEEGGKEYGIYILVFALTVPNLL